VESFADEGEVGVEVPVTLGAAQSAQVGRIAVGGQKGGGRLPPVPGGAPACLPPGDARDQISQDVGHEGAGDVGLVGAGPPVAEGSLCGPDAGGTVGQVIGQDLLVVQVSDARQPSGGAVHHGSGQLDDGGGTVQIGRYQIGHGHGGYLPKLPDSRCPPWSDQPPGTRPTTVTSGGSTMASSPGGTPVRSPR